MSTKAMGWGPMRPREFQTGSTEALPPLPSPADPAALYYARLGGRGPPPPPPLSARPHPGPSPALGLLMVTIFPVLRGHYRRGGR